MLRVLLMALLSTSLAASAGSPTPFGPAPRDADGRFQNRYTTATDKSRLELLRWMWDSARQGLPPAPQTLTPVVTPELAFLQANARAGAAMQPAVTWIGHASFLLQMGGLNLVTDPVFSERASPVAFAGPRRQQAPGLSLAQLPRIDAVLISHNHYDHLDVATVRALAAQTGGSPLFLVPLGLKDWLAAEGITHAVELDWWQSHRVGGVRFTLTPVQHWSARGAFDRRATLWGGWAVLAPELHAYFAGDTGYSPDFLDTRVFFAAEQDAAQGGGFDLALIPVGAYEPRWFMREQHVNPEEAVQIHLDLGAKRSIGMHWGSFELTDEPLDQPPRDLAAARAARGVSEADFGLLAIGQTERLAPRPRAP
ncbi:MAG TPA: MBL fold metallo-hydrolase [Nevskiaceae bacterium]|nr:MBL fold metallo-hydrolase [Nevskiaceae bacterium]